jgi:hypothetical protein
MQSCGSMGAATGAVGGGKTAPRLIQVVFIPRHFWAASADTHWTRDELLSE